MRACSTHNIFNFIYFPSYTRKALLEMNDAIFAIEKKLNINFGCYLYSKWSRSFTDIYKRTVINEC